MLYDEPRDIGEILNRQYQSAFSTPIDVPDWRSIEPTTDYSLTNLEFGESEIDESIGKLSATSAAGRDDIPAIVLKKCPVLIKPTTKM